jgi:AmmeMemoRadiSam system radical SAM enzyme
VEEDQTYLVEGAAVHNCQNWITSQALRDPRAVAPPEEVTPKDLVRLAHEHGARIITSTYNEPLITSEWAMTVFREAKAAGLVCSYVSNGNGTPEVLDYIQPWVSLYKVDLKSFRDRHYRELGGTLERVLWTIHALHERGFWVEIVTLTVPGFNDSDEELRDIARYLVSVSPDIPWHVTAFHKDYKMTGPDNTTVATLLRAAEIGASEGLRYVYAGNIPGQVRNWENTYCPGCGALLIERRGFRVLANRIPTGVCPDCRRASPASGVTSAHRVTASGARLIRGIQLRPQLSQLEPPNVRPHSAHSTVPALISAPHAGQGPPSLATADALPSGWAGKTPSRSRIAITAGWSSSLALKVKPNPTDSTFTGIPAATNSLTSGSVVCAERPCATRA